MTVQPTPDVPADATGGWPTSAGAASASASASGVSPANYGGSSGSPVSPDVATYTGAAVKTGVSISAVLLMAVAIML